MLIEVDVAGADHNDIPLAAGISMVIDCDFWVPAQDQNHFHIGMIVQQET